MSAANREHFDYCQQLLNEDEEYLLWLDVMNQTQNGYKPMTDFLNQQEKAA